MIEISKSSLKQIEYLFEQSAQGIHLVFDHSLIAEVLRTPTENMDFFTFENMKAVQDLLAEFVKRETLPAKLDYLSNLKRDQLELLIRTYFNIVENAIFEATDYKH